MGTTPAKTFPMPTPFGGTPQANNVSQVQPLAQNQGPGFAAAGASDQTQQQPASTPMQPPSFGGGGQQLPRNIFNMAQYKGMMQQ